METIRVEMVVAVAMRLDAIEWAAVVSEVLVVEASGSSRPGSTVSHVRCDARSIPAVMM